ncbi:3-keto-disaccharide hydrolase [Algoriphagus formosus]|uniref:3-keto-disaccharide hydrolase n=1 Tax=Algoriphagus formosus TaxID=2007308 RepID=UPI003F704F2B
MTNRLWTLGLFFIIFSCQKAEQEVEIKWQELFNGKDIQDWQIKIRNHPLNENHANTFRVEDGNLSVRYDGYEDFGNQYGHIFYKEPFSYYLLQVEYRFIGEQAPGGEGWAYRNSGAMLHSQNPESMLQDQDFPISIEGQFLGGNGIDERSTCNLCTPGTNVVMGDTLFTPHCINSNSKTFQGDQWVQANFLVLGAEEVHHLVGMDTVLSYYQPQIGGGMVSPVDSLVKIDGKLLESGYIALQSESHPIDIRRVALIDLSMLKAEKKAMSKLIKEALELSKIDPN